MNLKKSIPNAILLLCSIALCLVLVELLLRIALPALPMKLHAYINPGIRPLVQPTKKGVLPHDYIALLGDSYSLGDGDERRNASKNRNHYFNPAQYLHDKTGMDVVTFGRPGAGSLRGIVEQPIPIYEYANSTLLYSLERPRHFFVLFYEGNDLDNNINNITALFSPTHPGAFNFADTEGFRKFITEKVIGEDPVHMQTAAPKMSKFLVTSFISDVVKNFTIKKNAADSDDETTNKQLVADGVNRALVGGREVTLLGGLQGPSMELTPEESRIAVYVFEQALRYSMSYFDGVGFTVVFLPSVASSYKFVSPVVSVQRYHQERPGEHIHPASAVAERSDWVASEIRTASERAGAEFIDARPEVRQASASALIHGPLDWKHYNRIGYTAISDAIMTSEFFNTPH